METFRDYGIEIPYRRTSGNVKVACPHCRDTRSHPNDKSLSVNLDKGVWKCHHCDWSGYLKNFERKPFTPKKYIRPKAVGGPLQTNVQKWFASRGISLATLEKCRITEGMEFMPQTEKEMNTIQFNYFLEGELVNVKYRTGNKQFKMCKDCELVPYNIDSILDAKECIITEGEMDCLTYIECGFDNVVSVPNGANSNLTYLDDFIEAWFEDKETIYIASDTDVKGRELREELIRRFGVERCKVVEYGDDCKDANEVLMRHGKEAVVSTIRRASDVKVDGVFTLGDYEDNLDNIYREGLKPGLLLGYTNLDPLISFESKRLCVVTGRPSSGKSEFVDEIVCRLNIMQGWKAAYFSPENFPIELHMTKLIERYTGSKCSVQNLNENAYIQAKDYLRENVFHVYPTEGYYLDYIIEKAEYLVKRKGVRMLVIDPYNRLESQQGSKSETQYISEILDKLTLTAQKLDILIFLVAHPRKPEKVKGVESIPTLYDINGSANFYNKADYGIIVDRNYSDKLTLVRIQKVKFRHLGKNGDAWFRFNVVNGRYVAFNMEDATSDEYDYTNYISDGIKKKQIQREIFTNEELQTKSSFFDFTPRDEAPY